MAVREPLAVFKADLENDPDTGYPELTADMKFATPVCIEIADKFYFIYCCSSMMVMVF